MGTNPQGVLRQMQKLIYFYVDLNYGSSLLRGSQICDKLKELGYSCKLIFKPDPQIKESIIFVIKQCVLGIHNFHKSNFIIWDVVDFINSPKAIEHTKECWENVNLTIYHNQKVSSYLKKDLGLNKNCVVIPHHWDIRLKNLTNKLNNFKLGYIGDSQSSMYLDLIDNKDFIGTGPYFQSDTFIKKFTDYNCFFDIKNPDSFKFKMCSAIKLSTASALGVPIIINKTWSNLDLLSDDSILYCEDSNKETVINKINQIKSLYGTKEWSNILDVQKEIRERTSLDCIINLYLTVINEH